MANVNDLKKNLASKKIAERLAATKQIFTGKVVEMADDLFAAYLNERQDRRTWSLQSEMIKALGALDYKPALKEVNDIVRANIPHDAITIIAAIVFVQLKRKDIYDAEPVLELLSFGSTSVICGALMVLAFDKMLPPKNEVESILKAGWDINKHEDRLGNEFGLVDPRVYLANACAGWDSTVTREFLCHCVETAYNINRFGKTVENTPFIQVCMKSLKGEYSGVV